MPAVSPAVLTRAVRVLLPEPDPGVTDNHDALSLAVQFRAPPTLLTVNDWFAGFAAF